MSGSRWDWTQAERQLGLDPLRCRVLVLGGGKTGCALASLLAKQGISVTVADSRAAPPELAAFRQEWPQSEVITGSFDGLDPGRYTHLSVSPGLALSLPPIVAARQGGVRCFSDIDLFAVLAKEPIVAVTGANGKSTVTTLVGRMAKAAGRTVRMGGNLGVPAAELLAAVPSADLNVLELSSFQLERTSHLAAAAATVLNISPDHLDRHAGLDDYARQKARVFHGDGAMILNAEDPLVAAMARPERRCVWFGVDRAPAIDFTMDHRDGVRWLRMRDIWLVPVSELRISGRHNVANALAAAALADAVGVPADAIRDALAGFTGLEHRMQWVAEIGGVHWYNDSKATNLGACQAALAGIDGPVVLIAGGDGKGQDFHPLAAAARGKLRAAVLIGRDAPRLERALAPVAPVVRAASMHDAVELAWSQARPGDTVLLAPACSSLDQFRDYAERGQVYTDAVLRLKGGMHERG